MKLTAFLLIASASVVCAELPARFVKAIHQVESGGRQGMILGDYDAKTKKYRSIGPLQIQYAYFKDSGVKGEWLECTNLTFSIKVMESYFKRYCPKALANNNLEILAKTHNGGLNGPKVNQTQVYWAKVKKNMR